jgi:CRP/FNR family transcriptional regulator, dissimilatory nitrate respiration regulator
MSTSHTLQSFPLFSGLSPTDSEALQRASHLRRFPTGTRIFNEGEPARGFYLVASGCVKVYKVNPRGQEQVIGVMSAGQTFAEAVAFLDGGYPASAETLEDSELFYIEREAILGMITRDPEFALRMMAGMALKLRRFVAMVEDLTLRDAKGRIARYLLGLAPETVTTPCTIKLPTQQTVLARLLGLTGETLSRTLKNLREEGVVGVNRSGSVEILSIESLRDVAGELELV